MQGLWGEIKAREWRRAAHKLFFFLLGRGVDRAVLSCIAAQRPSLLLFFHNCTGAAIHCLQALTKRGLAENTARKTESQRRAPCSQGRKEGRKGGDPHGTVPSVNVNNLQLND